MTLLRLILESVIFHSSIERRCFSRTTALLVPLFLVAPLLTACESDFRGDQESVAPRAPLNPADKSQILDEAIRILTEVRAMADDLNRPIPGTALAEFVNQSGHAAAYCTDYARVLKIELGKVGIDSEVIGVSFNTNVLRYDAHTLNQVIVGDEKYLFDPTFASYVTSGGVMLSAREVREMVLDGQSDRLEVRSALFDEIEYYISYPLLFLNFYFTQEQERVGSILPFLTRISSAEEARGEYFLFRSPDQDTVTLHVTGFSGTVSFDGVDRTSRIYSLTTTSLEEILASGEIEVYQTKDMPFSVMHPN